MRKRYSILCILCMILLVPAILSARQRLPLDAQPLIEAKYGSWSGVLRLWVCEGWPTGSGGTAGWLNRCIATFEKAHPGVYVQPEYVSADALAAMRDDGMLPPDMALFPPGVIADPDWLEPLSPAALPRAPLDGCGEAGGALRAVPVMAGGYLWAYNAAMLPAIPGSWRDTDAAVSAPADEPFRQWSAALLALCSAKAPADAPDALPETAAGELDLGLPGESAAATPAPTAPPDADGIDCALPEDFAFDADAWRRFANGDLAAIPVTQREIRRLEALSAQGRGVDWRLAQTGAAPFTDQLLCIGIVARGEAGDPREPLCAAFVDHLLSDGCQGELYRVGAFSVTGATSGYGPGDALAAMEQALRSPALAAPNCFDTRWRDEASGIVREFIEGGAVPAGLWRRLAARLAQKAEH